MQSLKKYLAETEQSFENLSNDDNSTLEYARHILEEKSKSIQYLQNQVTKYKADSLKSEKMVKQLQQKIMQLSPNISNTGSNFMMPSQFKQKFDEFMKTNLSITLSPLLDYPQAYSQYAMEMIQTVYDQMQSTLNSKLSQICIILGIDPSVSNNTHKIKYSLLKILQDDWQNVIGNNSNLQGFKSNYDNSEILQIEQSPEFIEMQQCLIKLCAYMILQEKQWKFTNNQEQKMKLNTQNEKETLVKMHKFTKKDYTCIDGWIREGQSVYMVLEGIYRNNHNAQSVEQTRHPNLKNYVIPHRNICDEQVYTLTKKRIQTFELNNQKSVQLIEKSISDQQLDKQGLIKKFSEPKLHKFNEQRKKDVENRIYIVQSLGDKQKIDFSGTSSPMAPLRPIYLNNEDNNKSKQLRLNNRDSKQKNAKNGKKSNHSKSKHGLITDPSFQQIINLPKNRETPCISGKFGKKKKDIDQLPLRRQINNSSRTKKNTSRKGSVGKIVQQGIECGSKMQKQNRNNNKQMIYKDLIKQKLCEGANKTERVVGCHKEGIKAFKQREQDRPLRMMHMKKMREKYLNI